MLRKPRRCVPYLVEYHHLRHRRAVGDESDGFNVTRLRWEAARNNSHWNCEAVTFIALCATALAGGLAEYRSGAAELGGSHAGLRAAPSAVASRPLRPPAPGQAGWRQWPCCLIPWAAGGNAVTFPCPGRTTGCIPSSALAGVKFAAKCAIQMYAPKKSTRPIYSCNAKFPDLLYMRDFGDISRSIMRTE
jgi:hypothetical protein